MDKIIEETNLRKCKKCNDIKKLTLFQKYKKNDIYKYRNTCLECYKDIRKEYNKKNYEGNKERYKEKYYKYEKKEKKPKNEETKE